MWYLDLYPHDPQAVPGSGLDGTELGRCEYAIVFPAPGLTRPDPNLPVGPATTAFLNQRIPADVRRSLYLTTLIKTPQNLHTKKFGVRLIREYAASLREELRLIAPKRILAVGSAVADLLCPGFQDITEDHGALFTNPDLPGSPLVVPTYAISSTAAQPQLRTVITRDVWRWLNLAIPEPPPFKLIESVGEVDWHRGADYILDIETTGFNARHDQILSIGFKAADDELVYIWKAPKKLEVLSLYQKGFKPHVKRLIGHNFQFDLAWLFEWTKRFWDIPIVDTMLMAHNSGEESLKLKHLTTMYTDRPGSHAFGNFEDEAYLAEDVLSTEAVYHHFKPIEKTYIHWLVNRVIPIAAEIKWRGIPIDYPGFVKIKEGHQAVFQQVKTDLEDELPPKLRGTVNWNAPEQVAQALRKMKIPLTEKTDKGAYTVKESVLLVLQEKYPIVAKLLKYREQEKLEEFLVQYTDLLGTEIAEGYPSAVHPTLKIHGTKTGRTSCEKPNVQQIDRTGPLKTVFVSSFQESPRVVNKKVISAWTGRPLVPHQKVTGKIGLVDLAQAELRGACLLSGDEQFAAMLMSEDVHRSMASIAYKVPVEQVSAFQRKKVKGVIFGILYGGSVKGLAARINVDVAEVQKIYDILMTRFPKLARFIQTQRALAVREQRVVDPFGRIRDFSTTLQIKGRRAVERQGINTPIQGLANHISLLVMQGIFYRMRELSMKSRILIGIHDSTILDIQPSESVGIVVQEAFEALNETPLNQFSLWGKLPIVGELIIGQNWAAVESTHPNYHPEQVIPVSSHPLLDLSGGRQKP